MNPVTDCSQLMKAAAPGQKDNSASFPDAKTFNFTPSAKKYSRKRLYYKKKRRRPIKQERGAVARSNGHPATEEPWFEVEAIIGHRLHEKTGQPLFLIKWLGYGTEDNTWEPAGNMENCLPMLHSYILAKVLPEERDDSIAKAFEDVLPAHLRKMARLTNKRSHTNKQPRVTKELVPNKQRPAVVGSSNPPSKPAVKTTRPRSLAKDLQLCETNHRSQPSTIQEELTTPDPILSTKPHSPHYLEQPLRSPKSQEPSPVAETRSSHSSTSSLFNEASSMRFEISVTPGSSDQSRSPSPEPANNGTSINGHISRNFLLLPKASAPMPLPRLRRRSHWPTPVPTRAAKHFLPSPVTRAKKKKRSLPSDTDMPMIKQAIRETDTASPNTALVSLKEVSVLKNHNGGLGSFNRMQETTASILYKQRLAEWMCELNRQRDEMDAPISIENEVDFAEPPVNFRYISNNIYCQGVPDPSDPDVYSSLCGCQCYSLGKKCGSRGAAYCCPKMANAEFAYTKAGKIQVKPGTPIYECNSKCTCPLLCGNRVVQKGRTVPLCIFRTNNGRGWGVKTKFPIKANTFVTEYVGEVITSEEADRRGREYDVKGATYLFDLDFEDDNSEFTIDAAVQGNISHFFNHSCQPNLCVFSVWIECLDKRLPRIAFFATRNIYAEEELTFDYQMNYNTQTSLSSPSRHKKQCLCGSEKCLGYYW